MNTIENRKLLYTTWVSFVVMATVQALYMAHTIEFTDQALSALAARSPDDIKFGVQQYQYHSNILYNLGGETLYGFRLAGFVFLLIATMPLACLMTKISQSKTILPLCLLYTVTYYKFFMVNPSYGYWNYIGILLFLTGLLAFYFKPQKILISGLFVGFGGYFSLCAKPTTALILALIALTVAVACVVLNPTQRKKVIFFGVTALLTCVILILAHIVIFSSLSELIVFYQDGLIYVDILSAGHNASDMVKNIILSFYIIAEETVIALSPLLMISLIMRYKNISINKNIIFSAGMAAVMAILIARGYFFGSNFKYYSAGLGLLILSTGYILFICKLKSAIPIRMFLPALIPLTCVFAWYFGSNGILIPKLSSLIFIILIAHIMILRESKFYLSLSIPALLIIAFIVQLQNYQNPYRNNVKVYNQKNNIQVSDTSYIKVDDHTANYVTQLRKIALKNEFEKDTLLIDMTGGTPLANYILNANFMGFPWVIGGYKGSVDAFKFNAKYVDNKKLNKAWILTSNNPNGRFIAPKELSNIGLRFPSNYIKVGNLPLPIRTNEQQTLWKPR